MSTHQHCNADIVPRLPLDVRIPKMEVKLYYLTFIKLIPSQSEPQKCRELLFVIQFSFRCFTSYEMAGPRRHFMPSNTRFRWRRIGYHEICMSLLLIFTKSYTQGFSPRPPRKLLNKIAYLLSSLVAWARLGPKR